MTYKDLVIADTNTTGGYTELVVFHGKGAWAPRLAVLLADLTLNESSAHEILARHHVTVRCGDRIIGCA